jgi:hypothetical protein
MLRRAKLEHIMVMEERAEINKEFRQSNSYLMRRR